jgi:hypothetical protein
MHLLNCSCYSKCSQPDYSRIEDSDFIKCHKIEGAYLSYMGFIFQMAILMKFVKFMQLKINNCYLIFLGSQCIGTNMDIFNS